MKKNWTAPEIETIDINETALGSNTEADDGTTWGQTGIIVGPCDPS